MALMPTFWGLSDMMCGFCVECVEKKEEAWSRVLFSRADAVCERGVARTMGRQANSSGWGWYQRAERAKFRRVVVDANGQVERWETGEQAEREKQMYRDNNNNN